MTYTDKQRLIHERAQTTLSLGADWCRVIHADVSKQGHVLVSITEVLVAPWTAAVARAGVVSAWAGDGNEAGAMLTQP